DDARAALLARFAQGTLEVLWSFHIPGAHAEALRIACVVDFEVVSLEAIGRAVAAAKLIAEADPRAPHLEPPYAPISVVHGNDDGNFEPLLKRSHELSRVHQVRAIADQDVALSLRLRHAHAKTGGDFIAHARIAELEMAGATAGRVPELQQ